MQYFKPRGVLIFNWFLAHKLHSMRQKKVSGKKKFQLAIFYFEGFTSIPTALTANDRNRRIQVYQASDG